MENNVERRDDTGGKTAGQTGKNRALSALWSFFSSMKTAVVLLLVLAGASVVGTLIPQNGSPEAYIEAYDWAGYAALRTLGLTDLYHSGWYTSLLALISLNLLVCSINRFGIAWRRTFRPKVGVTQKQITNMQRSEKLSCAGTAEDAAAGIETALRAGSYHVSGERQGDGISLYAAKGRLGIWGPYLTHLSVLAIFAGAILGNRLGFDGYTIINEGGYADSCYVRRAHREKDLGFRVALRRFTIEHDKAHNPTGYKSDLRVYDGGRVAARKVIDVNHPLTYKGVSFFQSDYGLAGLILSIKAPDGEAARVTFDITTQDGEYGKEYVISGESFKQVQIGGKTLTVFVHNFAPDYVGGAEVNASFMPINPAPQIMVNDRLPEYKGLDAWSNLGWIAESKSADYKGFTITVEDAVRYTGLQVARNPGLPVVYSGFGLMLVGVFVSFYVTHRIMRIRISPAKGGVAVMAGAVSRGGPSGFDTDFDRLRETLR